jgi:acyl carrier protein
MEMEMDGNEIRRKTRNFVIEYLEGFNEFTDQDKFIEMGIVTNDFVFSLKQFIENEFHITISGEDFYKNNLSINSIGKFIEMKQQKKMKKQIDLISEIMMCLASIMGNQVFPLEVEFLEKLPYWNVELEADFKEQLVERFNIDIDLSKLKPLTFDKIADYIKHEQASDTRKTRERIRNYVEANCVVFDDEAEFSDQDNFYDFGMVNSLFAMKLVTWLEQQLLWGQVNYLL